MRSITNESKLSPDATNIMAIVMTKVSNTRFIAAKVHKKYETANRIIQKNEEVTKKNFRDFLIPIIRICGLAQIFHQNLSIARVAKLGNTLLTNLAYTLTSEPQFIAYFLETFLVAANAEAFADNDDLTVF